MADNTFSKDVEEYSDRRLCFADGITTDFQSFHHAKGHQVLDMNDRLIGVASDRPSVVGDGSSGALKPTTAQTKKALTKDTGIVLSPRSQHLSRKMEKLKRQLRNTTSLEEEEEERLDNESSLEDGPFSLEFAAIEKKRKWWLEHDRGEETDPQSSDIQSSGPYSTGPLNNEFQSASPLKSTVDKAPDQETGETKAWYDLSTLDLEPQMTALAEDDHHSAQTEEPVESKGYLSSSPDPISGDTSYNTLSTKSLQKPIKNIFEHLALSLPQRPVTQPIRSRVDSHLQRKQKQTVSALPDPMRASDKHKEAILIESSDDDDECQALSTTKPRKGGTSER
ncbi:hypothetical protein BGZ65_003456 [Modicella reniformis]|uniref:Uncharacterized protein n=1 Tax=Modicella reniformis TaxID=1440133 RepID=A0A9P6MHN6_9FUNG|nr:hypothetical protein BGZ65_003456 [Modicella reniformis]